MVTKKEEVKKEEVKKVTKKEVEKKTKKVEKVNVEVSKEKPKKDDKVIEKVVKEEEKSTKIEETKTLETKKEFVRPNRNFYRREEEKKDLNWGILHIYSSYNNTHLHVTDITGSETIAKVTGGMVTKSDRLKPSPNIAMATAKQISEDCKNKGYNALYVKLRAAGGHNGPMTPGPGSQAAIRMLTRYGIRLGRIEDVTPVPHDSCRKKGGKRGRRP